MVGRMRLKRVAYRMPQRVPNICRFDIILQFLAYMYMGRAFVEIMQCRVEPQCLPAVASFSIWPQSDSRCPHLVGGGSSLPPGGPGRGRGREDKKKRHATDQPGNLT